MEEIVSYHLANILKLPPKINKMNKAQYEKNGDFNESSKKYLKQSDQGKLLSIINTSVRKKKKEMIPNA